MESLRLNHGDGYGPRYFTSQAREWLSETAKRDPDLTSFAELYERTSREFFRNDAERDRAARRSRYCTRSHRSRRLIGSRHRAVPTSR